MAILNLTIILSFMFPGIMPKPTVSGLAAVYQPRQNGRRRPVVAWRGNCTLGAMIPLLVKKAQKMVQMFVKMVQLSMAISIALLLQILKK